MLSTSTGNHRLGILWKDWIKPFSSVGKLTKLFIVVFIGLEGRNMKTIFRKWAMNYYMGRV